MRLFVFGLLSIGLLSSCGPKSRTIDEPEKYVRKGTQKVDPFSVRDWLTKDLEQDGVAGTSAERAYTLKFMNAPSSEIIVAVIDSGVDISHQDLQSVLWTNSAEATGKAGVDDDKNGYVDDIYGWNYLGGFDKNNRPTHIDHERYEITRELARLRKKGPKLSKEEAAYKTQLETEWKSLHDEAQEALDKLIELKGQILALVAKIKSLNGLPESELTFEKIKAATTSGAEEASIHQELLDLLTKNRLVPSGPYSGLNRLAARMSSFKEDLNYYLNLDFDPRKQIVGDDPDNFKQVKYGNPVVQGPTDKDGLAFEADHGTHVAGIIAGDWDNGLGIRGVSRHAKIMSLRAVPNGDEYDKDVALAVRYAADNGAKIINMSFGKTHSPHKSKVDEAFLYAASKGVLILHAAGNESSNTDLDPTFPNRHLKLIPGAQISTWLDIGASTAGVGPLLVANFSNFGKTAVDFFSPGHQIYSSIPGNQYAAYSGTSMATPAAAGVAALVWSRFPELKAHEIKAILSQSVVRFDGLRVNSPADEKPVNFELLSRTGGIVNAYRAALLACEYAGLESCD